MKMLDERRVAENLKRVIEALGGREQTAGALGISTTTLSNYSNVSGNKTPGNLVSRLISIGINGNWYLTGAGEMFIKEMQPPSKKDLHVLGIGRDFIALVKKAQESGTTDFDIEIGADPIPKAGPAPDLSPEQRERLAQMMGGQVPYVSSE